MIPVVRLLNRGARRDRGVRSMKISAVSALFAVKLRKVKLLLLQKTDDSLGDTVRHAVRLAVENRSIQVQETRLDDRGRRVRRNLVEGVITGHVGRDAALVKTEAGRPP